MEIAVSNRTKAIDLDQQIKTYANMAWNNLIESAKCLKQMRDTKLYTELGFGSFEEYTETSLHIKERQAYTYISTLESLGEPFLQSNASLGITKLSLLSQINPFDRDDVLAENDISQMSVKEVKQLVADNTKKAEQISFLESERNEATEKAEELSAEAYELTNRIAELEAELKAERSKPVEVAVAEPSPEQLAEIKAQAKAEVEKQAAAEKKAMLAEWKGKVKAAEDKAKEEAAGAAEKLKKQLADIDAAKAQALAKAEALEKKLAVASSPETVKFSFYFDAIKEDYQKIRSSIIKLRTEDPATAEKFGGAMLKFCEMMKAGIEEALNE